MSITLHLPRMIHGAGSLAALPAELECLGVRRPFIVSDQGLVKAGLVERLLQAIGPLRSAATRFDHVTENPLYADVDEGAALYRRAGCDGVVALGGGSVIDTAKCIALLASHDLAIDQIMASPALVQRPGAPLVVLPTTAGTGSEASPSAGIHPAADRPALGLGSRHLIARVAILDAELTLSLPPRLTAATGIDAISHCVEGYLSKNDIPFGEALALDGLRRAVRCIRRATTHGDDLRAREEMMLAAFAGGACIGMGLGPAHAIAIACSDQGFHHGVLSGIGLVATLDETAAHEPERVAALSQAFGLAPGQSLAGGLAALMRELALPTTLAELGYRADDVHGLSARAHQSHFNRAARHHPSIESYAALITLSLETR